MKAETQHLDFLISQYVDGSLEGAAKKSVEQKMLNDPAARKLYAEHREVQDVLDDYGSRIPLINWGEFDKKLEARLEVEALEKQRASRFRRRMKPVAAAAALLLAVSLGYGWHAFSHDRVPQVAVAPGTTALQPRKTAAEYPESVPTTAASYASLRVMEPNVTSPGGIATGTVEGAPVSVVALETNLENGFGNVPANARPALNAGSSVGANDVGVPASWPVTDPDSIR